MSSKIVNLTLYLVIKELETVLDGCPMYPYQVVFSTQKWRHQLILYILNQIPNYYSIIEDIQDLPEDPTVLYSSPEEQLTMRAVICQGIANVLQENADSLNGNIL